MIFLVVLLSPLFSKSASPKNFNNEKTTKNYYTIYMQVFEIIKLHGKDVRQKLNCFSLDLFIALQFSDILI